MRCVQAVLGIGILPLAVIAAPVHIILPDVVTLESGHAITLYSPPHRDAQATYAEPASDVVISVDQNMLLHALVLSAETDALPTPAASAYEHSKKLAQVPATSSDSVTSRATTTSHMLLLESIPGVSHTRTTEIPIITEFGDIETASVTPLSVVSSITPPKHKSTSTTSSVSTSSAPLLSSSSSSSHLSSAVSPSSSSSTTVLPSLSSSSSTVSPSSSSSSTVSSLSSQEDIFAWASGSTSSAATSTSTIPSNSGFGDLLSELASVSLDTSHESSAVSSSSAHSTSSSVPSSSSTGKEASPAHTTSASLSSTPSKPSMESMPESSPLTTSSLFAWLSQSLGPTDSSMVSTSTKSASSSTSDSLTDKSSSVTSHGWPLLHSTDSSSTLSLSTTPSNSENTVPTSNTARSTPTPPSLTSTTETSIGVATSEFNTPMTPLAWTTVDHSSSLQIIGSLAMLYPFTTSIPLLIAAPDSVLATASTNMFSRSITTSTKQASASSTQFWNDALPSTRVESSVSTVATSTQSVSATFSFPLADSSVGSTSADSASSRIAPISGHISSPLTLFSGDMVELIVSHSPTPAATPDISISTTQNLFDLPVSAARVEIPVSPESSQIFSKRSLNANASSLTAELLSEAAESARSLLSDMRNIATQSENSLPTRRNNSSLVRAVHD